VIERDQEIEPSLLSGRGASQRFVWNRWRAEMARISSSWHVRCDGQVERAGRARRYEPLTWLRRGWGKRFVQNRCRASERVYGRGFNHTVDVDGPERGGIVRCEFKSLEDDVSWPSHVQLTMALSYCPKITC